MRKVKKAVMDTAGRLSNELDEFCHMLDDMLTAIECYRKERPEQWHESARAKVMMEWQKRIEELVEQMLAYTGRQEEDPNDPNELPEEPGS